MQTKLDKKDLELSISLARQHELQERLSSSSDPHTTYSPKRADLKPRKQPSSEMISFPSPPSPTSTPPISPQLSPYSPHKQLPLYLNSDPRRNIRRSASQPDIKTPIALPVQSPEVSEFASFIDASLSPSAIPKGKRRSERKEVVVITPPPNSPKLSPYSPHKPSPLYLHADPRRNYRKSASQPDIKNPIAFPLKSPDSVEFPVSVVRGKRRSEKNEGMPSPRSATPIDSDASSSGTSSGSESDEGLSKSLPNKSILKNVGERKRDAGNKAREKRGDDEKKRRTSPVSSIGSSSGGSGSTTMVDVPGTGRRNSMPAFAGVFKFPGGKKEISFDKKLKTWFQDSRLGA
jgi:hypothetical protein